MSLSDRVGVLELGALTAPKSQISASWRNLREEIPGSDRKDAVERLHDTTTWDPGKADRRAYREALGRLAIWLEGWEAAQRARRAE